MVEWEGEVLPVGASDGRIVRVTSDRIEYIDLAGQDQVIDLDECARNWVQYCKHHRRDFILMPGATQESVDAWNARCVGRRGGESTLYWVELMNERKTLFEFETREARVRLLAPLMAAGWHTFDNE
jgi:hypothetical protein